MDEQRWRKIASLFDELVEQDARARAASLQRIGADDPELCRELEQLLASDDILERGSKDPVATPIASDWMGTLFPDVVGTRIGPWRALREIGRGGMGVVYEAARDDGQFEQVAALKLMALRGDPAGLRRRFLRERQILARLDHPHIARLLDGGVSAAGDPYFALEYIDGEPLTTFISRTQADLGTRLRLFLDVCSAVQFAHRQLIVHCDIKPSNVLVNRDGAVKLLDFGIANVLADEGADNAETLLHALTPAYASPEQLRGDPVTTASDVYALGAILYELLTGVRACGVGGSAPAAERLAAISDPRRAVPSSAADRFGDTADVRVPGVEPVPARTLRGDLDVLTAKALHPDPEQRYASVEALADDVRRWLAGAPIAARPPSARYRMSRFVARHRAGVALAALALLALVGALALALVQAQRAREQAAEARRAATLAQEQGERAEAVRRILVGVFEQAAPDAHEGQPITALQLLEHGQRQVERAIAAEPAVEADVATLIAELYVQVGVFDRAETLLARALEATADPRVPDDVKARVLIGIATVEDERSAHEDAMAHARQGIELLARSGRVGAQTLAKAHYVVAHSLISLGRRDEAEQVLLASLQRDTAALGASSDAVADTNVQLGNLYAAEERFEESERAFRQAIATLTANHGEDSYHVAHALNELSNMFYDKNDFAAAEDALRQSLQIRLRMVGPDHRDTLIVRHNLLNLVEAEGRVAEALPERLEVVARHESSGKLHPRDLGAYFLGIGLDQSELGDFAAAEASLRKAIARFGESLGEDSDSAISAMRALGRTQVLAGRLDEAESTLRRARDLQGGREPVDDLRVALSDIDLANLLRKRGQVDAALEQLRPVVEWFEQPARAQHSVRESALVALAETRRVHGDLDAAFESATAALALGRAAPPRGASKLVPSLLALARVHLARADAEAALPLLEEALRRRMSVQPQGDVRVLEIEVERVVALRALRRDAEATALQRRIAPLIDALPAVHARALRDRLG